MNASGIPRSYPVSIEPRTSPPDENARELDLIAEIFGPDFSDAVHAYDQGPAAFLSGDPFAGCSDSWRRMRAHLYGPDGKLKPGVNP